MTLPDGSRRRLGFRGAGPDGAASRSTAGWRWSGSRCRARSAGTRRGTLGEWTSPDPVPLFELFTRQRRAAWARSAAPRAPSRWLNALAHRLRDNAPRQGEGEHRRALRPRQRLLFGLARRDDDLQLGAVRVRRRQRWRTPSCARSHDLLDRLELEAGSAAAGDRLRLGNARDRGGEARRRRRRPDPVRTSRRPGPEQRDRARPG